MNAGLKKALAVEFESSGAGRRGSSFRMRRTRSSVTAPLSVSVRPDAEAEDALDDDDHTDALLEHLIKPCWEVCRVSPLFNLEYTQKKLELYAEKITQYVTSKMPKNKTDDYTTTVEVIKHLKLEHKHSDALQITVFNAQKNTDNLKQICSGILLSWGFYTTNDGARATRLPLMLCKGVAKVVLLVRQVLMKLFDCVITPMQFSQTEILLFSALITSFTPNSATKQVKYVYNVPFTRQTTTLDVEISANDIHNMWLSCFPNGNEPSVHNEENSQQWYKAFRDYMLYICNIDIVRLELVKLDYPSVVIQQNGKVQLKEVEITKYILKILCELSVILKSCRPKLAADND